MQKKSKPDTGFRTEFQCVIPLKLGEPIKLDRNGQNELIRFYARTGEWFDENWQCLNCVMERAVALGHFIDFTSPVISKKFPNEHLYLIEKIYAQGKKYSMNAWVRILKTGRATDLRKGKWYCKLTFEV
jgi:hypothetical protein